MIIMKNNMDIIEYMNKFAAKIKKYNSASSQLRVYEV